MLIYIFVSIVLAWEGPQLIPGMVAPLGWILLLCLCVLNGRPVVQGQENVNVTAAKGLLLASMVLVGGAVLAFLAVVAVSGRTGYAVFAVALAAAVVPLAWLSKRSIRS